MATPMSSNSELKSGNYYTLGNLFSDEKKIVIPDLQRDYCWGGRAWDKNKYLYVDIVPNFLDNLLEIFNSKDDNTLGVIYGYKNPEDYIHLCDGQQRITTLYLILGMINRRTDNKFIDYLTYGKEPRLKYAIRDSTLYFLSDLVCNFFPREYNKINVEDIKKQNWCFSEYDLDPTIQSMLSALKTIEGKFNKLKIDYNHFGYFITDNLKVIYYDMGNRTVGEETFVVINTTGEPLTATENLKPILIGNIENEEEREKASKQWEDRENWFWKNRNTNETTADAGLNIFFIWYWQIRLLQEKTWKNKKPYEHNPKELFTQEPKEVKDNDETPSVDRWENSCDLTLIHSYFVALQKCIEICNNEENKCILNTIEEGDITLAWLEKHSNIILPIISYLQRFKKPTNFNRFLRRLRKNHYDKEWKRAENKNFVDWRYLVQIIEKSETEEDVLTFNTEEKDDFKIISNVKLNIWYNDEELFKTNLREENRKCIEKWENHRDFMGDISFLIEVYNKDTEAKTEDLEKYFQNYIATIDLVFNEYGKDQGENNKQEKDIVKYKLSNFFRLFYLFIGCKKVGHIDYASWDFEGVTFSQINRQHLFNDAFINMCSSDNVLAYIEEYVKKYIKDENILDLTQDNFTTDKAIKLWLTLKVFNANAENVVLSYYDGNETGVAVYNKIDKNKLVEEMGFSLGNFICGFGVKSGGGGGNYVHTTSKEFWNKPNIIDTPFSGVTFNYEDRTEEQIKENKDKINEIIEIILSNRN